MMTLGGGLPYIDMDIKLENVPGQACGLRTETLSSGLNRMWWEPE